MLLKPDLLLASDWQLSPVTFRALRRSPKRLCEPCLHFNAFGARCSLAFFSACLLLSRRVCPLLPNTPDAAGPKLKSSLIGNEFQLSNLYELKQRNAILRTSGTLSANLNCRRCHFVSEIQNRHVICFAVLLATRIHPLRRAYLLLPRPWTSYNGDGHFFLIKKVVKC